MRGRGGKNGAPPTDLLVCFPSRTHLSLMPKPVASPTRPMEPTKQRRNNHHHLYHKQLVKSIKKGGQQASSPLLWAKPKSMGSEMDEPTSPKVTCAGQIKVRSKPADSSKNWQSVMEEIERIHHRKPKKKKPTWVEALGLKKDVTQFLSCLRGIRLDLPCFGSFHASGISSDDDDDVEEDQEKKCADDHEDGSTSSKDVFSKWFMVLEENQDHGEKEKEDKDDDGDHEEPAVICAPPPNALLLMRCRSAPAKSWLEENLQEEEANDKEKLALEEKENKESLILKYYGPEFFQVSCDIAKETWVVGGARDPLARSRSWKR